MLQAELDLLVLAFQQGDQAALTRLYQHFQRDLLRFAQWQLQAPFNTQAVAADLVQNVWLKVLKRIQRLEDPAVFTSWLYRAVRWEVADWHKQASQRLTDMLAEPELLVDQNPPLDTDEWSALLAGFSTDDQQLLRLFYQHELAQQDIALILQIPAGTVKSRLYRLRQQLAAQYQHALPATARFGDVGSYSPYYQAIGKDHE